MAGHGAAAPAWQESDAKQRAKSAPESPESDVHWGKGRAGQRVLSMQQQVGQHTTEVPRIQLGHSRPGGYVTPWATSSQLYMKPVRKGAALAPYAFANAQRINCNGVQIAPMNPVRFLQRVPK